MRILSARNLQLLWGALVALALVLLTVGVVAFFAHEGPWSLDALLSAGARRTAPQGSAAPAVSTAPAASAVPASTAKPQATRRQPGPTAVAPPPKAPPANAAEALRQVLGEYHDDATHTRSVTLTSSGKITAQQSAGLTVDDGLSAQSLQQGTAISGAPR